ncbi:MAG: radical SAM protein [Bacteroidetes bacterium]|nr:radical SAM protein [Bacteroidota bacterium]
MYGVGDYLKRGLLFTNNVVRPSHKKISTLMLYSTDLCNSKCLHCHIWEKRPIQHLPFEKIVEIMNSKCITKDTTVGMEGGEFILHPECDKILDWFSKNHPKYDLLTNCLSPEKVIAAVKNYKMQRLYISLDGLAETYKYMRGVDGFDKVIKVIEECKDIIPISLMFTLTPYNNFEDLKDVIKISKKYDIDLRIGIYNNIDFFDTKEAAHTKEFRDKIKTADINKDFRKAVPDEVKSTSENYDFLMLYEEWRNGNTNLKCHSILDSIVIHPNGNVPICQNLSTKLGNVYENSLDEIFNSPETIKLQKQHTKSCNKCWINFHRKYDVVLLRSFEKLMPKKIIEMFYGKYQWCENKQMSYKKYMKKYID